MWHFTVERDTAADAAATVTAAQLTLQAVAYLQGTVHQDWRLGGVTEWMFAGIVTLCAERFYVDFPAHPGEVLYKFDGPSTMKPTQAETVQVTADGKTTVRISGDVRMTPFHDMELVETSVLKYAAATIAICCRLLSLSHRSHCTTGIWMSSAPRLSPR